MNKNNHNKFQITHNELVKFCGQCTLTKEVNCGGYDEKCREFSNKFDELYYTTLYPFHPCKECLAISSGSIKPCACSAYWHFCRMRLVAECEIKNNVVFFTGEKIQIVCGPADLITEEYLKSNSFFRKAVDFQVTAAYIAEIKSEPIYSELLSTVKQYLEYAAIHSNDDGKDEFIEEFYRL
jgi:hypothetical protein